MTTEQINAAGERVAGRVSADHDTALLDVNEVAALLNCSARHIYRLADAGKMPSPVKLGALVRWNRGAIQQWIADGCARVRRRVT